MHLTFSLPLGQTEAIKVLPGPYSDSGLAPTIVFKASFESRAAFLQAQASGVKVELWTDLPIPGRYKGEWGAIRFEDPGAPQNLESIGPAHFLSLRSGQSEPQDADTSVYLHLRAPLQDRIGLRFSFTYRLAYPSGEVKWLGTYGMNGEVAIERGWPGIILGDGWQRQEDGTCRVRASSGCVLADLETPEDWTCWVWNSASLPIRVPASEGAVGAAMALLPRPSKRGGAASKPLMLAASRSALVRLAPGGSITLDGEDSAAGQVQLGALEHTSSLLHDAAALCNGVVMPCPSPCVAIATRVPGAALPFHVVALPTARSIPGPLHVPFRALQPLAAADECDGLALFSPDLRKATIVRGPLAEAAGYLHFDYDGGEVIASPTQIVKTLGGSYELASLCACRELRTEVRAEVEDSSAHALPTPPPTPPARLSSSIEDAAVQVSPVAEPEVETRPSSPTPTLSTDPSSRPLTRRRTALALVRTIPARVLRAYIHALLNVLFWFWTSFLKSVVARMVGRSVPRRISSLLRSALLQTASRSRRGRSPGTPRRDSPPRIERCASPESSASESVQSTGHMTPPLPGDLSVAVSSPQACYPSSSPAPFQGTSTSPRVVISAALLPTQTSSATPPASFLWAGGPIKEPRATLDGMPLPAPSVVPMQGSMIIISVPEAVAGGQLEVSFET